MKIKLEAKIENLDKIISFSKNFLASEISSDYNNNFLIVAIEEIFTNISSYAFGKKVGSAELELVRTNDNTIKATFTDSGYPFNPIEFDSNSRAKENVDNLVSGGLGLYIVKNTMKNLKYENVGGCNIFSFETAVEGNK